MHDSDLGAQFLLINTPEDDDYDAHQTKII